MKKLILLFAFCILLFAAPLALAQTPTESVATTAVSPTTAVHLTFPIPELGNCASASECKTYCDDPTNIAACVDYAKMKGFYHESSLDTNQAAIVADAKATLGCDSVDSCKTYCADVSHADACSAFAQKHNLKGGNESPNTSTLEKAKLALGCDSAESCKALCEKEENREKCSAFAKSNGLKGGNTRLGPGGCTSESSCKVFCSDPNNFQLCSRFLKEHTGSTSGQKTFTGPGGCTSEATCREYCTQNPTACHLPPLSGTPRPTGPTPTGFHLENSTSPTLTPDQYCHLYPDHCAYPTPTKYPTPNYTEYCQSKGPGCTYTGTTCLCPTPTPATGSNTSGGDSTPTPTHSATSSTPTPSPTGTVQGVATQRNFFQWLMDNFFHLK
ncbi:MAG TPA: hypothetical protein VEW42_05180 [Candidatus Eisenbacteria bacterium]|nr:hypothetical protein [Candidatus Eisenbacteria bacterium]